MNVLGVVSRDRTEGSPLSQPVRYIHSHAALRGVAALLVVAYHLQFGALYRLPIETATPFFNRCYLMVDLFFILSGFVISLTSGADRRQPLSRGEIQEFYVARLARLYPLHLFCLCFILTSSVALALLRQWHHPELAALHMDAAAARSFVEELLLIQAWIPGAPFWNIPSWSISAEIAAYLCFPLLLTARSRAPRAASGMMMALALAFYVALLFGGGSLDIIAGLAPLRCLSGFIIGMLLYDARHVTAHWPRAAIAVGQIIAASAILAIMTVRLPDPAIVPFFALLVITTWQDRGPLPRLLRSRALRRAGELSYSIYLTHVCAIGLVAQFWYWLARQADLAAMPTRAALIVLCFAATLLVSSWTYAHVERTGGKFVRRLLSRTVR